MTVFSCVRFFFKNLMLSATIAFILFLVFGPVFIPTTDVFAVATLQTNETVSNVSASTLPSITFANGVAVGNGTIPAITFAGGVTQVKATRTLTVNSAPSLGSTTIGTCVIGYALTGSGSETDCSDNVATIDTDIFFDASGVAGSMRTLTSVTDSAHGALTVSGGGTSVIFTTTGTETSATAINFSDSTGGSVTSSSSTSGVVGVAASVQISITNSLAANATDKSVEVDSLGAIDLGTSALLAPDVAGAIRSGITGAAGYAAKNYTVAGLSTSILFTRKATGSSGNGALTINDGTFTEVNGVAATASATISAGIGVSATDSSVTIDGVIINLGSSALTATETATAIAGATYTSGTSYVADGAYTVSNIGPDITFTRSSAGTTGNNGLTVADDSYGATAQVVTFTPAGLVAEETTYVITINGTGYTFIESNSTAKSVVEGLSTELAADTDVSCTEDDAVLTCTADIAGTAFTYSSSVDSVESAPVVSGNSGSVVIGGYFNRPENNNIYPPLTAIPTPLYPQNFSPLQPSQGDESFYQSLGFGVSNDEVARLQKWLSGYPTIYPDKLITGYFGEKTREAVLKFQLIYEVIPSKKDPGAGHFGPKTRALVNSMNAHRKFLLLKNQTSGGE